MENYSKDKKIENMKQYLEKIKSLPPEERKVEAKKSLFESGVADENGKIKEQIVTEAHY